MYNIWRYDAWLRYPSVPQSKRHLYANLPDTVVTLSDSPVITSSVEELTRGLNGLLAVQLKHKTNITGDSSIILTTTNETNKHVIPVSSGLLLDGYHLHELTINKTRHLVITSPSDAGVLYGTFALLRRISLHRPIDGLNETQNPDSRLRYTNEWDNLDGTIERGFAGKSIFFANDNVVANLSRAETYARLLASVGINGCAVNNVNPSIRMIKSEFMPQLQRLAQVFNRWAIKVLISIDFSSPKSVGGLDTYDPLDSRVKKFWSTKTSEIASHVPNLGGYVLKADAEGRAGPARYNRTIAQAANTLANALKPHNGILCYRGFVYKYPLNWTDLTVDRAKAAYENFAKFDGQFDDNVIIQIKFGPLDFQIREAVSPLLGALKKTNIMLEVEVTQEYTGQQRHTVYLAPLWKWVLDFDLRVDNKTSPVKELSSGNLFKRPYGGLVGVVNVGLSTTWMGNHLSMANVYALGRLGWDSNLTDAIIADEWTRLTFGHNKKVVDVVMDIQLKSHEAFENYSGPLGAGSMTEIHTSKYGPHVMASENDGFGQWHRPDQYGIGIDRTVAGLKGKYGTGFIGQYNYEVSKMYENLNTCPDNLVLFMHHINYTHILHSGKTVIQYFYDSHYAGAETVQQFHKNWVQLKGLIDEQRYQDIEHQLFYQSGHSIVWRDSICQWFKNTSNINDIHNRVGHYSGRIEAESMQLIGYTHRKVDPWETASQGLAVECKITNKQCSAQTKWTGHTGAYEITVQYYDESDGISQFSLYIGDTLIKQWLANDTLPANKPSGDTSTRITVSNVHIKTGDHIIVKGSPDKGENAIRAIIYYQLKTKELEVIEAHQHSESLENNPIEERPVSENKNAAIVEDIIRADPSKKYKSGIRGKI
ncbi:uncharacterized protein LOC128964017 [Oppia nitens]|uniref:uncharacterized protein LOC128964017 n=1 Tax=Oppia nitens TaxID=1686743 RepID=UPI0023DBEBDA|nr:uncharacterized protein LOC128964017 [Oppia nitens]